MLSTIQIKNCNCTLLQFSEYYSLILRNTGSEMRLLSDCDCVSYRGRVFSLDYSAMRVCDMEFDRVRRLTTPTSPAPVPTTTTTTAPMSNPSCYTVWKYYCRDNFGWREYSEVSCCPQGATCSACRVRPPTCRIPKGNLCLLPPPCSRW